MVEIGQFNNQYEMLKESLGSEVSEDRTWDELCEEVKDLVVLRNDQEKNARKQLNFHEAAQQLWRVLGYEGEWVLDLLLPKLERIAKNEFARKQIRKTAKGRDLVMSDRDIERTYGSAQDETIRDLRDKVAQLEAELVVAQDAKQEALDNMNTVVSSLRKVSAELIVERGRTLRSQVTAGNCAGHKDTN